MYKKALLFLSLIFSFIHSAINDGFALRVNQWSRSKMIAADNLPEAKDQPIEESVTSVVLQTASGIVVPVTFYDRKSDVIIIAAQGLPALKESMAIYAQIFPSYDLVLFDYRWCHQYGTFLAKSILAGKPVQKILFDELEELETVVVFARKKKSYRAVVGLGECYGCFHLAKLQSDAILAQGVGPFTHLILDSCWYSLRDFAERICYDPLLPISPQDGGAPQIIKWVTNSSSFKYTTLGIAFFCMNDVSIKQYLSDVNIPILFVHGKNDLFVPSEHFDKIWNATNKGNRAALLTPFRHSDNLRNKKLYRYVAEQFIASQSMQDFEQKVLK